MSIQAYKAIWQHSKMKGNALLLLLALAEHSDEGGRSWPGIGRLADFVGVEKRSIKRLIVQCETAGELAIQRGGGRGYSSQYLILLMERSTVMGDTPDTLSTRKGDPAVTLSEINGDASVTHSNGKGDAPVTVSGKRVTGVAVKGDTGVTRSLIESIKEKERIDPLREKERIKNWQLIKNDLEGQMTAATFQANCQDLTFEKIDRDPDRGAIMVLKAPDQRIADRVNRQLGQTIGRAAAGVLGEPVEVWARP